MGRTVDPGESGKLDGVYAGGDARANWRLSRTGEGDAVADLAAVRTSANAPPVI